MNKKRTMQLIIAGKDKVSKVLKKVTGGLKKFGVGALKITGAAAAGFGAVGIAVGVLYGKLAGLIDEQAKVASSLGITNEQLGVYRDAAGYAGVANAALTTSLKKMSQNIADAANGIGEGADAIEALGLNADDLQKMGPEKAFAAIIEKLDQIPNGIEKTGLAMDLFGRSGAAMTNLTSKGLQQAQKDADTLGLKLTSAQAANVEASNDAWARIKNAGSDFLKHVAAKLAPGIKGAFDKAFEWAKGQDLQNWAAKAAKGIGTAFQAAAVILGGVAETVIAISRGLAGAVRIVNDLTKESLQGLLARQVKDLDAIKAKIQEIQQAGVGSGGEEMSALVGQRDSKESSIRDIYESLNTARQMEKTTKGIADNLAKAQGFTFSKEAQGAMQTINGLVKDIDDGYGEAGEKARAVDGVVGGMVGTHEAVAAASKKATESQVDDINTLISRYNELNLVKLSGTGNLNLMPSPTVEQIDRALEDEADR